MSRSESVAEVRRTTVTGSGNTYTRDAVWTLAGNVVYAAASWGAIAAIARLGSPAMVGQFVLAIALISPVLLFAGLQLQTVLATDARDRYRFREYLGLRLLAILIAASVVMGITAAHPDYRGLWLIIALVLAAKAAESASELCYGLFQRNRRMDLAGRSRIARATLGLAALAAGLWLTESIAVGLAAFAAVWIASLFILDLSRVGRFAVPGPALGAKRAWALTRLGFPLGLTLGLISLNVNIPRYVLERVVGLDMLGFYSAMVFFNVGLAQVSQAACQAASPRLAVHFVEDAGRFIRLTWFLLTVMACAAAVYLVVVFLLGEKILAVAYGGEYSHHAGVFWVVALCGVVELFSSVVGYSLTAARYFAIQPVLRAATVLVCVAAVYPLTRQYGMAGTAWGALVASSFSLLLGAVTLGVVVRRARQRGGRGRSEGHEPGGAAGPTERAGRLDTGPGC